MQLTSFTRALSLWLGTALAAHSASAAPRFAVTDLGTLGGSYGQGNRVNDAGQVAGFATTASNAVLLATLGGVGKASSDLTTLGGLFGFAADINAQGQLTGTATLGSAAGLHAFLASANTVVDLGTLGGSGSRGMGVNDLGDVTGAADMAGDAAEHAFYFHDAQMRDLGTLGGVSSQGNSINAAGQITGWSEISGSRGFHAFIWQAGRFTDLATLGGSYAEGLSVNSKGSVAGYATSLGDQFSRAVLWVPGQPIRDLGTLGGQSSTAYGINATDQVVGTSTTAGEILRRAFLWEGDVMTDLNSLIPPGSGMTLTEARGISDNGNITGIATVGTEYHAFLLTSDQIPPTVICPPDIVTTSGLQPSSIGRATATDNLDPAPVVTSSPPVDPIPVFAVGQTTGIVWKATDASGNVSSCTQQVTIGGTDGTPPVVAFSWQSNGVIAQANPAGWYSAMPLTLVWSVLDPESPITSQTGCAAGYTVNQETAGSPAQSCSAISAGGTVSPAVSTSIKVDITPPVLVVPGPVRREATGPASTRVDYVAATATDSLSGVKQVVCEPASASAFPMGDTSVTCAATDNAGNVANGSFLVTVADQSAPVLSIPADMVVPASGPAGAAVTFAATAADAVDGAVPVNCVPTSGSTFGVGTTVVNCTATDAAGNPGSAQFKVQVQGPLDQTPPVIVPVVAGSQGSNGWYVGPVAVSWNISDPDSAIGSQSGGCAPITVSADTAGTTLVCSATSGGGAATASVDIKLDTVPPSLQCPADVSVSASQTVALGSALASDNLTTVLPVTNDAPASFAVASTTPVTWKATDAAGLQTSCVQTVQVAAVTEPAPAPNPVALNDLILFRPGKLRVVPAAGILANDSGSGVVMRATVDQGIDAAVGKLSVAKNGGLRFRAKPTTSAASFTYRAAAAAGSSQIATVSLRADVAPLPQADACVLDPAGSAVSGAACSQPVNGRVLVDLSLNDADPDAADVLAADGRGGRVVRKSIAILPRSVKGGVVVRRADGRVVVRPKAKSVSFSYTIADDLGMRSLPQTFDLTIQ